MKKQTISILLTLCIVVKLLPTTAFAVVVGGSCGENLTWTLAGNILTISGTGNMNDYTGGYDSENPWYENNQIKAVVIEPGVTGIGAYAFYYCRGITSVSLPDGLLSIGEKAFYYCDNLEDASIPSSVSSIGEAAFGYCTRINSIEIPSKIKSISSLAYSGCNSVKSIVIPDGVTTIGSGAFSGCTNLEKIEIPESVISVGSGAFRDCFNLTKVNLPSKINTLSEYLFYGCGNLPSIEIPNGVSAIGQYAFGCCRKLANISIPNSVTSIGEYAFHQCDSLEEIALPDSIADIGAHAFFVAKGLKDITIPGSVSSIRQGSFYQCENLSTVVLEHGVTSIEASAFGLCKNLTSITIPQSVTNIGENTFLECDQLTIYGYKDSYAETYTKENDLNFSMIGSAIAGDITDDMLFYDYPLYLNNAVYDEIVLNGTMQSVSKALAEYDGSFDSFLAAYKYCLKEGGIDVLFKQIVALNGITDISIQKKLARGIAQDLILEIGKANQGYIQNCANDFSKTIKWIQSSVSLEGKLTEDALTNFYYEEIMGWDNLTLQDQKDARNVANSLAKKALSEEGKKLGTTLETFQLGVDAYEYISLVLTMGRIEMKVYDDLANCFPHSSPIRDAIIAIKKEAHDDLWKGLLKNLVNENLLDLMTAAIDELGGSTSISDLFGVSGLSVFLGKLVIKHVLVNLIPGQDAGAIIKTSYLFSAVADTKCLLNEIRLKAYNGELSESDIERYKTAFSANLILQKMALESAKELSKNSYLKQQIENQLETFNYASYQNYLSLCKSELLQSNTLKYSLTDGTATIVGVETDINKKAARSVEAKLLQNEMDAKGILYIPETIDGYPVANIDQYAFSDNNDVRLVVVKPHLSTIGENAFKNCTNLQTVLFLNPVIEIQNGSFSNCAALTAIEIPSGTEKIASGAFSNCEALQEIYIPASVTSVDADSFIGVSDKLEVRGDELSVAKTIAENLNAIYEEMPPNIYNIIITSIPQKTVYYINEPFDTTGLRIKANYENGIADEVLTGYQVIFDSSTTGKKEAVVLYKNVFTSIDVEVIKQPIPVNPEPDLPIDPEPTRPIKPEPKPMPEPVIEEKPTIPVSTIFTDVKAGKWYEEAIQYVYDHRLMAGVGNQMFGVNVPASRAMVATVLWSMEGNPAAGSAAFTDVVAGKYYSGAVGWAANSGIVGGYRDHSFRPNEPVTREQLAVMLYRYAGSPAAGGSLNRFADSGKVSSWARAAMEWAVSQGIIAGKEGRQLDPKGSATRAEVAVVISLYCKMIEAEQTDGNPNH